MPKIIIIISATLINIFLIYSYFSNFDTAGERSANGFGALFLIVFLVLLNLSVYIIFFVKKTPIIKTGMFIAILPIICAFSYSLINGGSMFDENSGGGGYLWLLMVTLPLGLLIIIIGLIMGFIKHINRK
jgi:uncharacterized membrane protein